MYKQLEKYSTFLVSGSVLLSGYKTLGPGSISTCTNGGIGMTLRFSHYKETVWFAECVSTEIEAFLLDYT